MGYCGKLFVKRDRGEWNCNKIFIKKLRKKLAFLEKVG